MEALGAIVFLPADEQASPLFLQKILFDPAALWLAHALKAEGVTTLTGILPGTASRRIPSLSPPAPPTLPPGWRSFWPRCPVR